MRRSLEEERCRTRRAATASFREGKIVTVSTVRFQSFALARRTTYSVILLITGDGPFPVLLHLCGYSETLRLDFA